MLPLFQHFIHPTTNSFSLFPTQNLNFIPHIHLDYEVVYVLEGTVEVTVDCNTYTLYPTDVCLIASHQVHSFHTPSTSKTLLLILDPSTLGSLFSSKTLKIPSSPVIPSGTYHMEIKELLEKLHIEQQTTKNALVMQGYLMVIMGRIHSMTTYTDHTLTHQSALQLILKYMSEHYQEPISLDTVASHLGLSRSYVSSLFNTQIGFSFNSYRNTLRVDLAKSLLLSPDYTITEIAFHCGFESLRSFNRVFKDLVGVSPSLYQKQQVGLSK
ncbi:MAG: AraC family transcriptional regulator [Cellulosilyticaceae bacterium]